MIDYSKYLFCANDKQVALIDALTEAQSVTGAAKLLGINPSNVTRQMQALERKAEREQKTRDMMDGRVHCMIPDTQVTPSVPTDHLEWIGEYLADIRPDVIVHIGDHADMESLSSYDKGKKSAEGKRVINDIDSANKAFKRLSKPILDAKGYNPELHITLGNHEHRINRHVDDNANLDGFLGISNLNYADLGWNVHDFLTEVEIDGVSYCHFFPNPMSGKPWGGMMQTMIKNVGYSFSMGHQQRHTHDRKPLGNGKIINGLVSGACYLHDEDYKGRGGNVHFRGIVIKNEVFDGNYDIVEISLDYLCRKYEGMRLFEFMQKKYPDIYHESVWLQRLASRHQ